LPHILPLEDQRSSDPDFPLDRIYREDYAEPVPHLRADGTIFARRWLMNNWQITFETDDEPFPADVVQLRPNGSGGTKLVQSKIDDLGLYDIGVLYQPYAPHPDHTNWISRYMADPIKAENPFVVVYGQGWTRMYSDYGSLGDPVVSSVNEDLGDETVQGCTARTISHVHYSPTYEYRGNGRVLGKMMGDMRDWRQPEDTLMWERAHIWIDKSSGGSHYRAGEG